MKLPNIYGESPFGRLSRGDMTGGCLLVPIQLNQCLRHNEGVWIYRIERESYILCCVAGLIKVSLAVPRNQSESPLQSRRESWAAKGFRQLKWFTCPVSTIGVPYVKVLSMQLVSGLVSKINHYNTAIFKFHWPVSPTKKPSSLPAFHLWLWFLRGLACSPDWALCHVSFRSSARLQQPSVYGSGRFPKKRPGRFSPESGRPVKVQIRDKEPDWWFSPGDVRWTSHI